jgi:hypothetical protein
MSFEILNRYTGAVIYTSKTADNISDAVREAIAAGVNLSCADLHSANLSDANLSGVNFRDTNLSYSNLSGSNLCGANLHFADLRYVDFSGSDLRGANLRGADLSGANLEDVDFSGVDLSGANLYGTNPSYSRNFVLQIQGSLHQIVAVDDDVRIGCQRHKLNWWLTNYKTVGEEYEYDESQIEEYGNHLLHVAKCLDLWKAWKD